MITIELIEFTRPNSPVVEMGIRVTNDELGRSIVIDGDFNPVVNCIYAKYRQAITHLEGLKGTHEHLLNYLNTKDNDTQSI